MYDIVVAGGSIAGLCCAREAASAGCSVLVVEEGREVGTPDHCGGMASMAGLRRLGIEPRPAMSPHRIVSGEVFAPSGRSILVGSEAQDIVSIDRRQLDKEAARQAQKAGATIRTAERFVSRTQDGVRTSSRDVQCKIVVDARGVGPLAKRDPGGIIPCAQWEVCAGWIRAGQVEVHADAQKYPGFFAWVIPSGDGYGKAGAAGRGINAERALEEFVSSRGPHSVTRRISAPVWVGGPSSEFVRDGMVAVGDAAGQSKPTTAGGIYSCGTGGMLAGRAIAAHLLSGQGLGAYQREWHAVFGAEFRGQMMARRMLEKIDNAAIESLVSAATPAASRAASEGGDFDFHLGSLVRLLGLRGALGAAGAVIGGNLRRAL